MQDSVVNLAWYNPNLIFVFFWIIVTLIIALYLIVWKAYIQNRDPTTYETYFLLTSIFCTLLSLLAVFSTSPPIVDICDHYKIVGQKKICVPKKQFLLPAPFLEDTDIQSPSATICCDESGKQLGNVSISIVKFDKRTMISVTLPDDVAQKIEALVDQTGKRDFYLDIYSNGTLWKAIPFEARDMEKLISRFKKWLTNPM